MVALRLHSELMFQGRARLILAQQVGDLQRLLVAPPLFEQINMASVFLGQLGRCSVISCFICQR